MPASFSSWQAFFILGVLGGLFLYLRLHILIGGFFRKYESLNFF